MKRRALLLVSGAAMALACVRLSAQTANAPRLIAWLVPGTRPAPGTPTPFVAVFTARLKELGFTMGRDIVIEARFSDGVIEKLPERARELLALKPALVITNSSAAILALKKETSTVPIVFYTGGSLVAQGIVASLAHPGGNVTGVSNRGELDDKVAELIREVLPRAKRVAILSHESDPVAFRLADGRTLRALGFEVQVVSIKRADELEGAFVRVVKGRAAALYVPQLAMLDNNGREIGELATRSSLATFSSNPSLVKSGGLLSYNHDFLENSRRMADQVAKILNGANPGDLPVEQPDRFHLSINMRTAKTLGITIPQSVLLRATEVIE